MVLSPFQVVTARTEAKAFLALVIEPRGRNGVYSTIPLFSATSFPFL